MHAFYKTAQSLGQSIGTLDDATGEHQNLQKLGYALLDMARSACRVMNLLVQNLPAAPPAAPPEELKVSVEGEWQVAGPRGKKRN
jgi:hypothetical protein